MVEALGHHMQYSMMRSVAEVQTSARIRLLSKRNFSDNFYAHDEKGDNLYSDNHSFCLLIVYFANYCNQHVYLCLPIHIYLKNRMSNFRKVFYTCYLWPWLGPLTAVQYCLCTSSLLVDVMFFHTSELIGFGF